MQFGEVYMLPITISSNVYMLQSTNVPRAAIKTFMYMFTYVQLKCTPTFDVMLV